MPYRITPHVTKRSIRPIGLESRGANTHELAEYAGEMVRVLKTRISSRPNDTTCRIPKGLFCALDPLQQNVTMRRAARALPEKSLDEIIAAKPSAAYGAKWGGFVIDPAFFTRLVYQSL
jgi:hypothetical protein